MSLLDNNFGEHLCNGNGEQWTNARENNVHKRRDEALDKNKAYLGELPIFFSKFLNVVEEGYEKFPRVEGQSLRRPNGP